MSDPLPPPVPPPPPDSQYQTVPPELSEPSGPAEPHDPYAALRFVNYRKYFVGNAFSLMGTQMATTAIAYEIFARTHSAMALGMVGFVQILPVMLFTLPAGHIGDRFNRKRIVLVMTAVLLVSNLLMGLSSHFAAYEPDVGPLAWINNDVTWLSHLLGDKTVRITQAHIAIMYILLLVNGVVRAFMRPAADSLLPSLVPAETLANAVTWNSSLYETTNMLGPALAGAIIGVLVPLSGETGPWTYAGIYWFNALCQAAEFVNFLGIKVEQPPRAREPLTLRSLFAGARFVYDNKLILGIITLDMFAVLLGGAVALLPIFAKDVLNVGAVGYGFLRAAPSVGAISMALILAHRAPMKRAGRNLIWAVAGFGCATIIFGLSRNFWLSLAALYFTGVFDNVSVVVRNSIVQIATPEDMRGRVNAVNSLFISTSNQLGEFESGTTATIGIALLGPMAGPMIAAAAGGIGTIIVVVCVAWVWPQIRRIKTLESLAA